MDFQTVSNIKMDIYTATTEWYWGLPDVAFKAGPQSYGKIESSGWFHLYNYHKFRPMGCLGYHGDVGFLSI